MFELHSNAKRNQEKYVQQYLNSKSRVARKEREHNDHKETKDLNWEDTYSDLKFQILT